jgi:hypothetical protein
MTDINVENQDHTLQTPILSTPVLKSEPKMSTKGDLSDRIRRICHASGIYHPFGSLHRLVPKLPYDFCVPIDYFENPIVSEQCPVLMEMRKKVHSQHDFVAVAATNASFEIIMTNEFTLQYKPELIQLSWMEFYLALNLHAFEHLVAAKSMSAIQSYKHFHSKQGFFGPTVTLTVEEICLASRFQPFKISVTSVSDRFVLADLICDMWNENMLMPMKWFTIHEDMSVSWIISTRDIRQSFGGFPTPAPSTKTKPR